MDYKKIIRQSTKFAKSQGFVDYAEDFAQYVCERVMRDRKATARQLWLDFLKENFFGGKRLGLTRLKKTGVKIPHIEFVGLDKVPEGETTLEESDIGEVLRGHFAPGSERAMATLIFKWGFGQREVADIFGISQGRVSQLLKEKLRV